MSHDGSSSTVSGGEGGLAPGAGDLNGCQVVDDHGGSGGQTSTNPIDDDVKPFLEHAELGEYALGLDLMTMTCEAADTVNPASRAASLTTRGDDHATRDTAPHHHTTSGSANREPRVAVKFKFEGIQPSRAKFLSIIRQGQGLGSMVYGLSASRPRGGRECARGTRSSRA